MKDIPVLKAKLESSLRQLIPELRAVRAKFLADWYQEGLERLERLPPEYNNNLRDVLQYLKGPERVEYPDSEKVTRLISEVDANVWAFQYSEQQEEGTS